MTNCKSVLIFVLRIYQLGDFFMILSWLSPFNINLLPHGFIVAQNIMGWAGPRALV